jgi:nucleoside-diphosphate-sugar epimerase
MLIASPANVNFMNKITCAITGANGYVGTHVTKYLQSKGWQIYQLSRKPNATTPEYCIPYQLTDKNSYPRLQGIEVLIHCAYDFNTRNASESEQINVEGSLHLFKQAKQQGVKTIIFISSMSAFPGVCSTYGKNKLKIEILAQELGVIIIRPGLIYNHQPQGIIGAINKLIKISPIIPLIGKGQQIFYPCHVDDLAALLYQLGMTNTTADKPIIAAANQPLTFKKIIQTLAAANHKKILLLPIPYILIYWALRLAEISGLKLGLRSDSLVSMKHYAPEVDFSPTQALKTNFRIMDENILRPQQS